MTANAVVMKSCLLQYLLPPADKDALLPAMLLCFLQSVHVVLACCDAVILIQ